jgi:hypothetical protein
MPVPDERFAEPGPDRGRPSGATFEIARTSGRNLPGPHYPDCSPALRRHLSIEAGQGAAKNITELIDDAAAAALEHAALLQRRLRSVAPIPYAVLRECDADLHRLIGDIVSLRNAAELLKRTLRAS